MQLPMTPAGLLERVPGRGEFRGSNGGAIARDRQGGNERHETGACLFFSSLPPLRSLTVPAGGAKAHLSTATSPGVWPGLSAYTNTC
jgi:hypothetical protein